MKRFTIKSQGGEQLVAYGGNLAISRDGSYIVYSSTPLNGRAHLYRRRMDRDQPDQVPGTEGATTPTLSPDGQWIAFKAQGKLLKVGAEGGTPITLCAAPSAGGAAWGSDGMIYFTDRETQLFRVPEAGGKPQLVASIPHSAGQQGLRLPHALPGGHAILLVTGGSLINPNDAAILAFDLAKGRPKELIRGGTAPHYVPTGHLLYVQGSRLLAVPFDLRRLEVTGPAAPILEDVWQGPGGYAAYDISADGTLVFISGGEMFGNRELVWVDRTGKERPIIGAPKHWYIDVRLSPDGRRLAATTIDPGSPHDIWVLAPDHPGFAVPITHAKSSEEHYGPVWTPDGKSLLYGQQGPDGAQILRKAADGSGEEEVLYKDREDQAMLSPTQCSRDAKLLIFQRTGRAGPPRLWKLSLAGVHEAEPLFKHDLSFARAGGQISPDGQWIVYMSLESGTSEIYVAPYPGVETAKWRISTDGGDIARWSRDGRELYYLSGAGPAKLNAVDIHTSPTFEKGIPRLLVEGPYPHFMRTVDFDADPGGQRFILLKTEPSMEMPVEVHVVLNWTEELKARLHSVQK
ncbi:PD40 domain-containing protein [Edaphobacter aggregans]|uniref:PD40 domain-containing protein n=1 Tax=Edaphobacter aggregans TaxID=570835 RepID=UPI000557C3A1|nr:PD40 domain-containing protein [Edaphobacter aggregans]